MDVSSTGSGSGGGRGRTIQHRNSWTSGITRSVLSTHPLPSTAISDAAREAAEQEEKRNRRRSLMSRRTRSNSSGNTASDVTTQFLSPTELRFLSTTAARLGELPSTPQNSGGEDAHSAPSSAASSPRGVYALSLDHRTDGKGGKSKKQQKKSSSKKHRVTEDEIFNLVDEQSGLIRLDLQALHTRLENMARNMDTLYSVSTKSLKRIEDRLDELDSEGEEEGPTRPGTPERRESATGATGVPPRSFTQARPFNRSKKKRRQNSTCKSCCCLCCGGTSRRRRSAGERI